MKYIRMSERDIYALQILFECNIRPTSVTKKWVALMYKATKMNHMATDYQIKEIWRLISEFRNQIKDKGVVTEAKEKL